MEAMQTRIYLGGGGQNGDAYVEQLVYKTLYYAGGKYLAAGILLR